MWKLPRTQSDGKWRMGSTLWTSSALWVEGVCKGQLKFLSMHCANVWHFSMSCYQCLQTLQLVCWFDNSKFPSTWGCPKCSYLVTAVFSWTSLKTERLWSPFYLMLSEIILKISRVFILSAFKSPWLIQSKAERQHLLLRLVLGFDIFKVTSGSILNVGFVEVLRILCPRGDLLHTVASRLSNNGILCGFGVCWEARELQLPFSS